MHQVKYLLLWSNIFHIINLLLIFWNKFLKNIIFSTYWADCMWSRRFFISFCSKCSMKMWTNNKINKEYEISLILRSHNGSLFNNFFHFSRSWYHFFRKILNLDIIIFILKYIEQCSFIEEIITSEIGITYTETKEKNEWKNLKAIKEIRNCNGYF